MERHMWRDQCVLSIRRCADIAEQRRTNDSEKKRKREKESYICPSENTLYTLKWWTLRHWEPSTQSGLWDLKQHALPTREFDRLGGGKKVVLQKVYSDWKPEGFSISQHATFLCWSRDCFRSLGSRKILQISRSLVPAFWSKYRTTFWAFFGLVVIIYGRMNLPGFFGESRGRIFTKVQGMLRIGCVESLARRVTPFSSAKTFLSSSTHSFLRFVIAPGGCDVYPDRGCTYIATSDK